MVHNRAHVYIALGHTTNVYMQSTNCSKSNAVGQRKAKEKVLS